MRNHLVERGVDLAVPDSDLIDYLGNDSKRMDIIFNLMEGREYISDVFTPEEKDIMIYLMRGPEMREKTKEFT